MESWKRRRNASHSQFLHPFLLMMTHAFPLLKITDTKNRLTSPYAERRRRRRSRRRKKKKKRRRRRQTLKREKANQLPPFINY